MILCPKCKSDVSFVSVWPLRCGCGRVSRTSYDCLQVDGPTPDPKAWIRERQRRCRKECEHYLADEDGCGKLRPGRRALTGQRGTPYPSARCPVGRWWPEYRGKVGFLAVSYLEIGGTEIWHQTLIPRLSSVAGFVAMEESLCTGDLKKLQVPTGWGLEAARKLAAGSDVLVVWGIGNVLGEVLAGLAKKPKVISVSHCDFRSQWTVDMMLAQEPWTDHCVYICPTGLETVPDRLRERSTLIPNAPDPMRVWTSETRRQIRQRLGVEDGDKLLVAIARLSPEKCLDKLMTAVNALGEGWQLRIAGKANGWSKDHERELRALESSRVRIVAPVNTPADLLAAADGYLSASAHEGYGLSVAEAMIAGVPVISTPVGLLEQHPELACIVELDATTADWAESIAMDFAYEADQQYRAGHAKAWLRSNHNPEAHARRWSGLIDSLRARG